MAVAGLGLATIVVLENEGDFFQLDVNRVEEHHLVDRGFLSTSPAITCCLNGKAIDVTRFDAGERSAARPISFGQIAHRRADSRTDPLPSFAPAVRRTQYLPETNRMLIRPKTLGTLISAVLLHPELHALELLEAFFLWQRPKRHGMQSNPSFLPAYSCHTHGFMVLCGWIGIGLDRNQNFTLKPMRVHTCVTWSLCPFLASTASATTLRWHSSGKCSKQTKQQRRTAANS